MSHDQRVLDAITEDDLPDGYGCLLSCYRQAGYSETECIRLALLTGQVLGGIFYPLRKIDDALNKARRRLALADLDAGMSYDDIARRYDFSEQTVRQLQRDRQAEKLKKRQMRIPGA